MVSRKKKQKWKFNEEWEKQIRSLATQEAIRLMLEHLKQWHKEGKA